MFQAEYAITTGIDQTGLMGQISDFVKAGPIRLLL